MLKSVDAVTRMPQNSDLVQYLIGDSATVEKMGCHSAFAPFDDSLVDFLDRVSRILLKSTEAKSFPDVVTFAFWCRKASIRSLQKGYADLSDRLGRGVIFHIAPSNVAVNFAYSLAAGLLAGNANIVRLPSKAFPQVDLIIGALKQALDQKIAPYFCLLKYGYDQTVTDWLSAVCDVRVVWGGDQTIANIRRSSLKARAMDVTFADRYSLCVINADAYLNSNEHKKIAEGFFNDTYLTDQNACTSPRLVVWMGERIQEAQSVFWDRLNRLVEAKYDLQPVQSVGKYLAFCRHAAAGHPVHLARGQDNLLVRVKLDKLSGIEMDYIGASGYFLEYVAEDLEEIVPLCSSRCQTVSYFGFDVESLRMFLMNSRPRGIDRIVPIGKTLDFSLTWDGIDLIRSFSRVIAIA